MTTIRQVRHCLTKLPFIDHPLTWLQHRGLGPADRYVASYPRSGSTWLRFMLYELLTGKESNFPDVDRTLADVGKHFAAPALLEQGGRLLKTHEPFRRDYAAAIYLVRDVRDIVLSEYVFLKRDGFFTAEFDEFFPRFLAGKANRYGFWGNHVASWLAAAESEPQRIKVLRFEDLRSDPAAALAQCLGFLGVARSADAITQVVARHQIERMRVKEDQAQQFAHNAAGLRFITDGRVGKGRQQLTADQRSALSARTATLLARLGYAAG